MTFSGYLNVYNFQIVVLAVTKTDMIALKLSAYFWKGFLIHTDTKIWC